jgi:hypothetical protein
VQPERRADPKGPAQVVYGTLKQARKHVSGKSRGPGHTDAKWREVPGLLAISEERREPADEKPGDDATLRVHE